VANMEDVLDVYERPYNPENPVVCIDETNKQLVEERRIPAVPGQPEKVDSEYERNGVADVFASAYRKTTKGLTINPSTVITVFNICRRYR